MEGEKQSIAIAISTRGRFDVLYNSVSKWLKHYPDVKLIIVEDNGSTPRGIAATKNICIDKLIDSSAEHCFIVDDDIYPLDNYGLYLYCENASKHMCFTFDTNNKGIRISNDVFLKQKQKNKWIFNSPCGCLLYCHRDVLLSGVRYDENFGIWGMEHKDFSLQIHEKGLTENPFEDIPNSTKHFYSHDFYNTCESSVNEEVRISEIKRNIEYFNKKNNGKSRNLYNNKE